jgi:hypothetical protein
MNQKYGNGIPQSENSQLKTHTSIFALTLTLSQRERGLLWNLFLEGRGD